jgi:hypothetical protein
VICELRQSEIPPVAETVFLSDHTFLYKIDSWRNFAMTSPETSHTKKVTNKFSSPLVTDTTRFSIQIELQLFGQVFGPHDG